MARPRSSKPSYCRDKATERAYVVIDGKRHWLGPRGTYGTQGTRDEYDRLIGEWIARGRTPDPATTSPGAVLTVADVCLAFWDHAVRTYPAPPVPAKKRPEGELGNFWDALRPLVRLYGTVAAAEFGPVKLAAVRDEMIRLGWCRNFINRNVARLKHVFKWAVGKELLPGEVWHRLAALPGLQKGRSGARETAKVKPVPDAQVEAVLPLLSPQVRAMIKLQRLTGARSGELCAMRTGDIDTSDKRVWVYRPEKHKTSHHDQAREILLGPKARKILEPYFKPDLQAFVFSPAEAAEWHRGQRRQKRKTPRTPSQEARAEAAQRDAAKRKRQPGQRYTKGTYAEAIERACDIAFPPPAELARGRVKTPRGEKQTRQETVAEWRAGRPP